jgi:uncharacterized protein (DUF983 family)
MINKDSKFYSIIHQTCPQCHEGKMFASPAYSTTFMKMHNNCPQCGLDLIQEPSFYFGAMYFSYAIQVVIFVVVYFVLRYTVKPDVNTYIQWTIALVILLLPLNYRVSRVMWINLFINYQAKSATATK